MTIRDHRMKYPLPHHFIRREHIAVFLSVMLLLGATVAKGIGQYSAPPVEKPSQKNKPKQKTKPESRTKTAPKPKGSSNKPTYSENNFIRTRIKYSEKEDAGKGCIREFGHKYRLADWSDVVRYYRSTGDMSRFFSQLDLGTPGSGKQTSLQVSRNGSQMFSPSRHYYITRHDHNKPPHYLAHANIDRYLVSLGSWRGSRYALCIRR